METWKLTAAAIALSAIGSAAALAQAADTGPKPPKEPPGMSSSQGASPGTTGVDSPAGIPADPTTEENQQPGMSPQRPSDPATADTPAARVPTSPPGTDSSRP